MAEESEGFLAVGEKRHQRLDEFLDVGIGRCGAAPSAWQFQSDPLDGGIEPARPA